MAKKLDICGVVLATLAGLCFLGVIAILSE